MKINVFLIVIIFSLIAALSRGFLTRLAAKRSSQKRKFIINSFLREKSNIFHLYCLFAPVFLGNMIVRPRLGMLNKY